MKVLNKSPLQNEEKQETNLLAENLNTESSSSSHVQRYINTLAVVEEEQRSILMVESTSLAMALCLENNTNSCCDLITSDSQNISNLRREMNSAPQNVELEMSTTTSSKTQRDGKSSSGNPRHSTMDIRQLDLDLDEIQVDSSQYQTTFDTDRFHIETAVAILDDHDQVEITTFAVAAAGDDQQTLQQQQEQQHPPPTSN